MSVFEWIALAVTVWFVIAACILCLFAIRPRIDDERMDGVIDEWLRQRADKDTAIEQWERGQLNEGMTR